MNQKKILLISSFLLLIIITYLSCNSDSRIERLLRSDGVSDNVIGAIKAGKKGKHKFIPLLLKDAADWSTSTHISYKGVSVYQAKMNALKEIFKKSPPEEITMDPDSNIIKFYIDLYEREKK